MMFVFHSRPHYLLDIRRALHWKSKRCYVAAMTKGSGSFQDNRSARHMYVCVHEFVRECPPLHDHLH